MKINKFAITLNEAGFDMDLHVKELLNKWGVEVNDPCGENCNIAPTINDELRAMIQVLATRLLAAEDRITTLEAFH